MAYRDKLRLVYCTFEACPHIFMSSYGEKLANLKSGHDLDADKPGCTMSCQGGETNRIFPVHFSRFLFPTQRTDHRLVGSVVRSAPVEQAHKSMSNIRYTKFNIQDTMLNARDTKSNI